MKKKHLSFHVVSAALFFILSCDVWCSGADILITEFQAKNNSTITDKDGSYPDWIEIYNAGDETENLAGWFLTDDPLDLSKWRFPDVSLDAKGFLLVFASEKDLREPGSELHTNFKLSSTGEYLALVKPDGETVAWEYGDRAGGELYPPQPADFSYGLSMNGSMVSLVESNADARTMVPQNGDMGLAWTQVDFDDSAWISGKTGIGYDTGSGYRNLIETDVESEMRNKNTSVYIRISFDVDDPDDVSGLSLSMKYDDGFIAYINGQRLAESQAPASPEWDSPATADHTDSLAVIFEKFNLVISPGLLKSGKNILAIHGLNRSLGSSDMLIIPELVGFNSGDLDRNVIQFFDQPSPGYGNVPGYLRIAEQPAIRPAGSVFENSLTVTISVNSTDTEIRYTLNGGDPTESSTLYTGPFDITTSTLVRARGFEPGVAASPTVSMGYIALDSDVQDFSSNLPLVLIDNFNGPDPVKDPKTPAFMAIFEPGESGRTELVSAPEIQNRIGIEIRGSSTAGRPKPSYSFEFWDEDNDDKSLKPLEFHENSDWILYGPYNFDLALMRNVFIYELSNEIGRYATHSKFVELFFNKDGNDLSYSDYVGVYSFMEKIKRGEKRVDVEKLPGDITEEPEISGGYMLKIDRGDPGDSGFRTSRQGNIHYVYPKESNITSVQSVWIRNYLQEFEDALFSEDFRDPVLGYAPYVDLDSWVDHHILNVLAMNVDALRLSAYFFKTRGGKIEYGPVWDFDRSMGSTDGRDDNPFAWNGTGDSTKFFDYDSRFPWWNRLFQDPDAMQRWIDRWGKFRRDELSINNMFDVINGMAEQLSEASIRNFKRWGFISPTASSYTAQVNVLKNWLSDRATWIDSQFLKAPQLSEPGGKIDPGFELSITAPSGTIYYTTDGTDPRASGGGTGPGAEVYSGPIILNENSRVIARATTSTSKWSAPVSDTYVVDPTSLVITEIMYHPPDPPAGSPYEDDDFEFIEFYNRGSKTVDLSGIRFKSGVDFTFPQGATLGSKKYGLIVRNLGAFKSLYPSWSDLNIYGLYTGNLENRGERISVESVIHEVILDFKFSDMWWPSTDGDGYSLTVVDPMDPRNQWGEKTSWAPSGNPYGSPGQENSSGPGPGGWQMPGDSNQDGSLDLSDAVNMLRILFSSLDIPLPCEGDSVGEGANLVLLDMNMDGNFDIADVLYTLGFLFAEGPAPKRGTQCILIQGCPQGCSF